jgi:hypothetical protein
VVRALALLPTLLATAHAEPNESLRARGDRIAEDHGPYLRLDPVQAPDLVSFDASRDGETTAIAVGHTLLVLRGDWWAGDKDDPLHPHVDQRGNGWRAGIQLARDLGFVKVSAGASVNRVDTDNGSGTYRQLDLAVSRSKRFSRWMTAFVSLGLGVRRWSGAASPPGEANGHQVTLTIGTTFR